MSAMGPLPPFDVGDFHCGRCGTLLDGGTDEPVAARELRAERDSLRAEVERLRAMERNYEYRVVAEWPDFKGDYSLPGTLEAARRRLPEVRVEFPDGDVFIERRRKAGTWEALTETPGHKNHET